METDTIFHLTAKQEKQMTNAQAAANARKPYADAIKRIEAQKAAMLATLEAIARNDDACTCAAESWFGDGHSATCVQEMAGAAYLKAKGDG